MTRALDSPARAKFILQPYQHDIVGRSESWWALKWFAKADWLFGITGPYWYDTMHEGLYGDWKAKFTRVDMAVSPAQHPFVKRRWNPPGKRKLLAVGAYIPYKGLDLIAELARASGVYLGYYGNAPLEVFRHVPRFHHYGGALFVQPLIGQIADTYDGFLSLARGDANPTTLLETACWGLTGFCNKESGYWPNAPFLELRLNDLAFNLEQMEWLQTVSEYDLRMRAEQMRDLMVREYNWDKFTTTIWEVMQRWL